MSGHCLVHVRMLHYLCVGLRITIMQSHTHTMQQTRTHRAVTWRVEAKKLLSCQRQSEYSMIALGMGTYLYQKHTGVFWKLVEILHDATTYECYDQ